VNEKGERDSTRRIVITRNRSKDSARTLRKYGTEDLTPIASNQASSSGLSNRYQIMAPINTADDPAKVLRFIMHRKNPDRIPIERAGAVHG